MNDSDSTNLQGICPLCKLNNFFELREHGLVKCEECELIFSKLIWDSNQEEDVYYDLTENNNKSSSGEWNTLRWGQRYFLKKFSNKTVLDVGGGIGNFVSACEKSGNSATLYDSSTDTLLEAEKRGIKIKKNLDNENQYDVVTLWECIEHMHNPVQELGQIVPLIKDGGLLVLSTPNFNHIEVNQTKLKKYWPPYHVTFWTEKTLRRLLEQAGLTIQEIKYRPFNWYMVNNNSNNGENIFKRILHEVKIMELEIMIIAKKIDNNWRD